MRLPKTSRLFSLGEEITVDFHGGVTYTFSKGLRQLKTVEKNECYLVGWDYTHAGDQIGLNQFEWDKKWTVNEIQAEIRDVIIQLIELEFE